MGHLHSQVRFDGHTVHRYLVPGFLTLDKTLLTRAEPLLDEFDVNDHPLVRLRSFYVQCSI